MARLLTYSEAQTRFANVATTGITIAEAIQEAVDRIYEMGRYPGTTEEVALADSDFTLDSETGEYFLHFVEESYAGAIGFRSRERGWAIVDQTSLYKDGVNAGDREFVDMGTVSVAETGNITISGSLTDGTDPVVFPELIYVGQYLGENYHSDTGELPGDSPADGDYYSHWWTGTEWNLTKTTYSGGIAVSDFYWSSPDGAVWTPVSPVTGTPVVTYSTSVSYRKYRCPLGWSLDSGPYFALMKLEPPTLEAGTIIPVESLGALKCAIQAVCYEYVSDEDRANLSWQKFELFMSKSEHQVHGPKRFTMGMDSSLRRRPSQFS